MAKRPKSRPDASDPASKAGSHPYADKLRNEKPRLGKVGRGVLEKAFGKVAEGRHSDLGFPFNDPASEGPISRKPTARTFQEATAAKTQAKALPDRPKKLWSADLRGKSKAVVKEIVEAFIEDVYGEFLPARRDEMRDYLRRKDPKLHAFLRNYGFENLPDRFQMPSQRDKVQQLISDAASGGYKDMPLNQRRSVVGALRRSKTNPSP